MCGCRLVVAGPKQFADIQQMQKNRYRENKSEPKSNEANLRRLTEVRKMEHITVDKKTGRATVKVPNAETGTYLKVLWSLMQKKLKEDNRSPRHWDRKEIWEIVDKFCHSEAVEELHSALSDKQKEEVQSSFVDKLSEAVGKEAELPAH